MADDVDLRRGFHQVLAEIQEDITRLSATVIETIPRATNVLLDGDLEGADYVLMADQEIDARCLNLEERCYQVLALQAPVAVDLRRIVAAVKMIGEIERSGDLAVNICKAARRIYGYELEPRLRGSISKMSDQAQLLFRFAIDAYVESDAPLASAVPDMDDVLDRLHAEFIELIFECHARERLPLQVAVQLALVGRFYERIGDHAVNIARRVLYMVTGWMPGHEVVVRHRSPYLADGSSDESAESDEQQAADRRP